MKNARFASRFGIATFALLAGCNGGSSGASNSPASPSETQRVQAAQTTATTNANCTSIQPFYWEIGNQTSVLASGSTGDGSIARTTSLSIASSSKWLFGAYVVQKLNGNVDATTKKFLTMSAGYTSFANFSCVASLTVQACLNASSNAAYTAANDDKFYYNGGHFQKWGVLNGMGTLTKAQLVSEYQSQMGTDFTFSFGSPQLAGGVNASAAEYAVFLRKILSGQLLIRNHLGENAVCTLPSECATAVSSPIPVAWHYSYGHWVEDDATNDGSFSSAGLFGFYPWIDASKSYYGILSRYEVPSGGNEIGSGWASMLCGREIRKAYVTGTAR